MTQQYPQPQPAQFQPQPPPKKKMGKGKIALIVIGGFVALMIIVSIAGGGGGDKAATTDSKPTAIAPTASTKPADATKPAPAKTTTTEPAKPAAPQVACENQDDRSKPCEIQVGKPFKLGSHTVLAGWKTENTGAGSPLGMSIVGKAKNTDDKTSTMFVHIKFLKGDEVLANIMCNTGDLEPGQTEAMNCVADGTYSKSYDKVTAEATF
jgi:hypothetical protein